MHPTTPPPTSRLLAVALLLSAALLPAPTRAAAIVVTTTAQEQPFLTNGNCTLGEAITAANTDASVDACPAGSGPDTITLAPGATYPLTVPASDLNGETGLPIVTSSITITGNGATITRTGAPLFRLMAVAAQGALTLHGVMLAYGAVQGPGGGILSDGTLHLDAVTVQHNQALGGGGIAARGTLLIQRSQIAHNTLFDNSVAVGGGIALFEGDATIVSSVIRTNTALGDTDMEGGGIFTTGTMLLSDTLVVENVAERSGGLLNGGQMVIATSTISGNQANVRAGGLSNVGTLTLRESAIRDNIAEQGFIGAIFSDGTLSVINSTVSGNRGGLTGGIANLGVLTLAHSTLVNNTALVRGIALETGGVVSYSTASITLTHTLIANNALSNGTASDCAGMFTSQGYNLVETAAGCSLSSGVGDMVGVEPLLGPLADNGGPTASHLPLPGSPAIDGGDPTYDGPPLTDQRGSGFPRVVGGRIDIGAIEACSDPPLPTATSEPSQAPTVPSTPATSGPIPTPTLPATPPCTRGCVLLPVVRRL